MASFDLSEVGTPQKHSQGGYALPERTIEGLGYHVNPPNAISGLGKHCAPFGLGKPSPPHQTSAPRPSLPSVGRRKRRNRVESSHVCGQSFIDTSTDSPKKTPSKTLPFSPSRVHHTIIPMEANQ